MARHEDVTVPANSLRVVVAAMEAVIGAMGTTLPPWPEEDGFDLLKECTAELRAALGSDVDWLHSKRCEVEVPAVFRRAFEKGEGS